MLKTHLTLTYKLLKETTVQYRWTQCCLWDWKASLETKEQLLSQVRIGKLLAVPCTIVQPDVCWIHDLGVWTANWVTITGFLLRPQFDLEQWLKWTSTLLHLNCLITSLKFLNCCLCFRDLVVLEITSQALRSCKSHHGPQILLCCSWLSPLAKCFLWLLVSACYSS